MKKSIIVSRAPFRISLAGGGTDLFSYADSYGGEVVGFSINRFVTCSVSHSHDKYNRIYGCYREKFESVSELQNPFIRAVFENARVDRPVCVNIITETPPGSGLGGSASFLNSLSEGLFAFNSKNISQSGLASFTSSLEIDNLQRPVGTQDHYLSSLGGVNCLEIKDRNTFYSKLIIGSNCKHYLDKNVLLFHTNKTRSANTVLQVQAKNLQNKSTKTLEVMHQIKSLVYPMKLVLINDEPEKIGDIIDCHWNLKRLLSSKVSSPEIESYISTAKSSGATGVKVLGAGGAGYLMICTEPESTEPVRKSLSSLGLLELKFGVDYIGSISNKHTGEVL